MTVSTHRHLTETERRLLREMVDQCGARSVLITMAAIVGHDHPDLHTGDRLRSTILKVAKELATDTEGKPLIEVIE